MGDADKEMQDFVKKVDTEELRHKKTLNMTIKLTETQIVGLESQLEMLKNNLAMLQRELSRLETN